EQSGGNPDLYRFSPRSHDRLGTPSQEQPAIGFLRVPGLRFGPPGSRPVRPDDVWLLMVQDPETSRLANHRGFLCNTRAAGEYLPGKRSLLRARDFGYTQ